MAISQNQVNTGVRYLTGYAVSGVTVIGALGMLPPEQVTEFIGAVHDFNEAITQAVGALGKMWFIVGPLVLFWLAKVGVSASSVQGMLGNILQAALKGNSSNAAEAQKGLAQATATVVNATPTPMDAPEVRAANTEAKAIVLQSAVTMPEVVNQPKIVVNDQALADAVPSNSVTANH